MSPSTLEHLHHILADMKPKILKKSKGKEKRIPGTAKGKIFLADEYQEKLLKSPVPFNRIDLGICALSSMQKENRPGGPF
jgi:hypothetical protein